MPEARRSYIAVTVTLTSANTNYNLLALVNAILTPTLSPGACRELSLQNTNGNTASVLVGDAELSSTRIGYELTAGSSTVGMSRTYRCSGSNSVSIADIYVRSASAGQKLNVEICSY